MHARSAPLAVCLSTSIAIATALSTACAGTASPHPTTPTNTSASATSTTPPQLQAGSTQPTAECLHMFAATATRARTDGVGTMLGAELLAQLPTGPQALRDLIDACQNGASVSCENAGLVEILGRGVLADTNRGMELFQRACLLGLSNGCADFVQFSITVPSIDATLFERAKAVVEASCDFGSMTACNAMGELHSMGNDSQRNYTLALHDFERACDAGNPPSCANTALMYIAGCGGAPDYPRGSRLLARACDQGNSIACFGLAQMYSEGVGVDRDLSRATSYAERACTLGHPDACTMLGGQSVSPPTLTPPRPPAGRPL